VGTVMLALAASFAASPVLFGCNLVAAAVQNTYAAGGDLRAFLIFTALFLLIGFWQLARGLRAARAHPDPFAFWNFLISVGLALVIVSYWHDATAGLPTLNAALLHAGFVAVLADCAVNLRLQLRGLFRRQAPVSFELGPVPVWQRRLVVDESCYGAPGGHAGGGWIGPATAQPLSGISHIADGPRVQPQLPSFRPQVPGALPPLRNRVR
jgi:hypothetical protein